MDWLRCAEASLRAGEPLAGTAAEATHWLALEERGAWAPKPLKTPSLGPLAEPLSRWDAAHPGLRLQLIRRPRRREDGRRVLLGDVGAGTVFGATVDDRGLAELDVDRWLATGEPPAGFAAVERPVHLVCTHGKRDECCAVRGVALYKGLVAAVRELPRSRRPELWQTSHL